MIPLRFCGDHFRDWPWWMVWKQGHREHEYMGELIGPQGPFPQLMMCPGTELADD